MREILFRGKRTDNGKWVYGYFCGKTCKTMFSKAEPNAQIIDEDLYWHDVDPETVGQFTGLTDKNGKKIFEGDIVRFTDKSIIGKIVFECGAFGIGTSKTIEHDYIESLICEYTGCNNRLYDCCNDNFISLWEILWNFNEEDDSLGLVEVIGNIHDNPELLKGGAK